MAKYVTNDLVELFVKIWNRDNSGWREVCRERINYGWCYQFAVLMKRLHGDKAKLCYDYGHAWVKIGDKYYDSDTPNGTTDFKGLSGPPHGNGLQEDVSEEELTDFWKSGGSGPVQTNVILEVLRAYHLSESVGT